MRAVEGDPKSEAELAVLIGAVLRVVEMEIEKFFDRIDGKNPPKKKLICATCSEPVAFNVARFCWLNKIRFGENIYCRECQQAV